MLSDFLLDMTSKSELLCNGRQVGVIVGDIYDYVTARRIINWFNLQVWNIEIIFHTFLMWWIYINYYIIDLVLKNFKKEIEVNEF